MEYGFPILVALWLLVVAILVRRSDAKWERFVAKVEPARADQGGAIRHFDKD